MGGSALPEDGVLGVGQCGGPGCAWTPGHTSDAEASLPLAKGTLPGVQAGVQEACPRPGAAWPRPPTLQSSTPEHGLSDPGGPPTLTLAVAAVGGQPVSRRRAAALEASGDVDAAVGADVAPGGQGALVDVCDSKAPLSVPHAPSRAASPSGRGWGLGGQPQGQRGTGGLEVPGLGPPQRPPRRKGKLRPGEGRA